VQRPAAAPERARARGATAGRTGRRTDGARDGARDESRARSAGAKLVSYGQESFRIPAGKRRTPVIHLSRTGKRLIAHHRTTTVWANVTLSSGSRRHYAFKLILIGGARVPTLD
jgi:hypothetical protein